MYTMPPTNTTAAFEPFLYASMYEDSEIRMPGSSLSTASASSSNAGSPIHNDWRHLPSHTMGMAQPSIVGNDYGEYMDIGHHGYAGAQMEDMPPFDFTQATKGFVGEFGLFPLSVCQDIGSSRCRARDLHCSATLCPRRPRQVASKTFGCLSHKLVFSYPSRLPPLLTSTTTYVC